MSMLTDLSMPDDFVTHRKSCILPTFVSDPRYERSEIKHIFALHNHPFGSDLSPLDLRFIEEKASLHDWEIRLKSGSIRLSTIAFFSKSRDPAAPTCDGFHQYVPATREIMTWTQIRGRWEKMERGFIRWKADGSFWIEKR